MERLPALIAIALAAFTSNAYPFKHACRETDPYLGLGTGFRLDSIGNSNSQGVFKAWSAYRYDDRGMPVMHIGSGQDGNDTAVLTLGTARELKSIATDSTVSTIYLASDFGIDSIAFENTVSKSRIRTFRRQIYGDTLAWERYLTDTKQLVKALTIFSDSGRREFLVGDSAMHPLRNCLASGDTCSCATTLVDSSNSVPDLLYVYRNHLLEQVFSGTAGQLRSESRYHYHALDGLSLARTGTRSPIAPKPGVFDANGRRIDLEGLVRDAWTNPARLRNQVNVFERPERPR